MSPAHRAAGRRYREHTWVHPDTEPRRSSIHGWGLFAARDFEPGETVSIVGGSVLSEAEFTRFASTAAAYNAIQIGEDLHLVEDPDTMARTEGSLNHHCDSNLWMLDEVTLAVRLPVQVGSELTLDYALFTTSGEWLTPPCNCGSGFCRRAPRGTDWTLPEVQSRYARHFSPFLNERIQAVASSTC